MLWRLSATRVSWHGQLLDPYQVSAQPVDICAWSPMRRAQELFMMVRFDTITVWL